MLHTEFQASEPSKSKKEDFFFLYFYASNPGLSGLGYFGPFDLYLNKVVGHVVLKKTFFE